MGPKLIKYGQIANVVYSRVYSSQTSSPGGIRPCMPWSSITKLISSPKVRMPAPQKYGVMNVVVE